MKTKIFFTLIVLITNTIIVLGQSFTVSGPTAVTIPFGSSSVNAQFNFTYYNTNGLWYPALITKVDDGQPYPALPISDSYLPSQINIPLGPGTHTIIFTLVSYNWNTLRWEPHQQTTRNVATYFIIEIKNNFVGGIISVDGQNRNSPYYRTSITGDNIQLGAVEQTYGNYNHVWSTSGANQSNWEKRPIGGSPIVINNSQNFTYSVQSNDQSSSIIANLRSVYNINFQNSFTGVGNVGVIKVNQTQYNSPTLIFQVVEQNLINAEAVDQTLNGINYTFTNWSESGGTNRSWTFNPTDHKTYTAYFSGTPQPPSIAFNLTQNQPIRFTWTANPNNNVTYQVWRDIYHKATGWTHGWHQIATLPSGSNSYTDGYYIYGWGTNSYDLFYKIKAIYSVENTTS